MHRLLVWTYSFVISIVLPLSVQATSLLIPMDKSQTDHLKAYGVMYKALDKGYQGEWLLNYRGGSFLLDYAEETVNLCLLAGVSYEQITSGQVADIYREIEVENMERVELEKAPKIAVYSPPYAEPWDDAVTLALNYAEINYDLVYDEGLRQSVSIETGCRSLGVRLRSPRRLFVLHVFSAGDHRYRSGRRRRGHRAESVRW
jgi:hypothetical protein